MNSTGTHGKSSSTEKLHNKRTANRRSYKSWEKPDTREFIAWDSEGMTDPQLPESQQRLTLFGCSKADPIVKYDIRMYEVFDYLINIAKQYDSSNYVHIAFAFKYDVNMILRDLTPSQMKELRTDTGEPLRINKGRYTYHIDYLPGKWFQLTRTVNHLRVRDNAPDRDETINIKIYDMFSFFTCSFIKACKTLIPDDPGFAIVEEGKAQRGKFTDDAFVVRYWKAEIDMMVRLATAFRKNLAGAGFHLKQWYGPGALANLVARQNRLEFMKTPAPPAAYDKFRYAYYGGRFEQYRMGYFDHTVYQYDINSAYPFWLTKVPQLVDGRWIHTVYGDDDQPDVSSETFGVYRVEYGDLRECTGEWKAAVHGPKPEFTKADALDVHPFPRRDNLTSLIEFPQAVDSWYWSPEVAAYQKTRHLVTPRHFKIRESWVWHPDDNTKPLAFIQDMFDTRKQWKAEGNPSELALKLGMNSMYGKFAQTVGWDKDTLKPPKLHCLEWAGYATSGCRAQMYEACVRIGKENVIAIQTDGLYCLVPPDKFPMNMGSKLGQWEPAQYDEFVYLQSGIGFQREEAGWKFKYRGIDADSLTIQTALEHLELCLWDERAGASKKFNYRWPELDLQVTRFIGMGLALAQGIDMHASWRTMMKQVKLSNPKGKRAHWEPDYCEACQLELTAAEMPHQMQIRPLHQTRYDGKETSGPKLIPWLDQEEIAKLKRVRETLLRKAV